MGVRTFMGLAGAASPASAYVQAQSKDTSARTVTGMRALRADEIQLAKLVFRSTVPYHQVVVTDAVGASGRPFVVPLPGSDLFLMNVGLFGYPGMAGIQDKRKILIHELTHVWQGAQATFRWSVQASSIYHQARSGDDAYSYDVAKLSRHDWDDYNPEQQASIVEDWFDNVYDERTKVLNEQIEDDRYPFIVMNIRGDPAMPMPHRPKEDVSGPDRRVAKLPGVPVSEDYLVRLLEQRFAADDTAGYGRRFRDLQEEFARIKSVQAVPLYNRLVTRPKGDKLVALFYSKLSKAGQDKLIATLRGRLAAF